MFIRKEIVEKLRNQYPPGTRVELIKMDDQQAPPTGTQGTVTGVDDIGIVPENVIPVYCHSSFPEEDMICDFMNLSFKTELAEKIVPLAYWYPLEEITLA